MRGPAGVLSALLWLSAISTPIFAAPPSIPSSKPESEAWQAAEKRRDQIQRYRLTPAAKQQVSAFIEALALGKTSILRDSALRTALFRSADGTEKPVLDLIPEEGATVDPHMHVNAIFDVGYGLGAAVQGMSNTTEGPSSNFSVYLFQFDAPSGSENFRISRVREIAL